MEIYTGLGYDIHKLVRKGKFILGNVEIPYKKGFLAHSDGDVLIHALIDALLGACGLGDIGTFFSDKDPKYRGIDSSILLNETMKMIGDRGYSTVNADITVICQEPKLGPFKDKIKSKISYFLDIPEERVCIKAKTKELQDSTGKGKSVEVLCSVLVKREKYDV